MGQSPSNAKKTPGPADLTNEKHWKAENLQNKREVGKGPKGYVLEAFNTKTKTRCAVKILEYANREDPDYHYAFIKARRMCKMNTWNNKCVVHTYLCEFIEVENNFALKHKCAIVMEYVDKNLAVLINEKKAAKTGLNEKQLMKFMFTLLNGLACAHKNGVFHSNIKDENIFYCSNSDSLKLGDFEVHGHHPQCMNMKTLAYLAPECSRQENGNQIDWLKADVYAAGIALLKLSLLKDSFSANERKSLLPLIAEVAKTSSTIAFVLEGMLKVIPEERWSSGKCLKLIQETFIQSFPPKKDSEEPLTQEQKAAKLLIEQGLTHKKEERLRPALVCFERALYKIIDTEVINYCDRLMIANCLNYTAQTYFELKDYTNSLRCFLKCMNLREKFLRNIPHVQHSLLSNTGRVYVKLGDFQKGLYYHLRAHQLLKKENEQTYNINALRYLDFIATTYEYLGDYHNALENQMLLLEVNKKQFGADNARVGKVYRNISRLFKSLEDHEKGKIFENLAKKTKM